VTADTTGEAELFEEPADPESASKEHFKVLQCSNTLTNSTSISLSVGPILVLFFAVLRYYPDYTCRAHSLLRQCHYSTSKLSQISMII